MKFNTHKISQDLQKLDPELGKNPEAMMKMIKNLQDTKPTVNIDPQFKKTLYKKISTQLQQSKQQKSFLFTIFDKRLSTAISFSLILLISAFILYNNYNTSESLLDITSIKEDNSETPYDETKVKDNIILSEKKVTEKFKGHGFNPEGPAGTDSNTPPGYKANDDEFAMYEKKPLTPGKTGRIGFKNFSSQETVQTKESDLNYFNSVFLKPMKLTKQRILEYHIKLLYQSKQFTDSRRKLLTIIGEHGYIVSSKSSIIDNTAYLTTLFVIKQDTLYSLLQKVDTLGQLKSENISVIDHTADQIWQKIVIDREQSRIKRKRKTINRTAPTNKNWSKIEKSLQASEDRLDEKQFAKWKLIDKTSWAKVEFTLQGTKKDTTIQIPKYSNILIDLTNLFLILSYKLLLLFPLIILAVILWFKRKKIINHFIKK